MRRLHQIAAPSSALSPLSSPPTCSPPTRSSSAPHLRDLGLGGAVEAGAHGGQHRQQALVGVALDGVAGVHAGHEAAPGAVQALHHGQVVAAGQNRAEGVAAGWAEACTGQLLDGMWHACTCLPQLSSQDSTHAKASKPAQLQIIHKLPAAQLGAENLSTNVTAPSLTHRSCPRSARRRWSCARSPPQRRRRAAGRWCRAPPGPPAARGPAPTGVIAAGAGRGTRVRQGRQ